ncbi:MAG: sodium:solute symporter family protein [Acidobacteria bacterium]|nr:MAG: sodium:solute symporter family protein [Acidobacteriota bacterium]
MNFSVVDWTILIVFLVANLYAGIYGRRFVKNSADFLVASRSMGLHVGMISLVATEIGIITYMYYAEMGVMYGFTAFLAGLIPAAMYILVGRTGFVIKRCRELELTTIPQFFEARYGRDVRVLAGVLMAVGGALNFGVFPAIEATFLNIVTGIPLEYLLWTMVLLMALVLVYTAMGGMISVILTGYVQYTLLVIAMIIITIYCFTSVGVSQMVTTVTERIGPEGFNPAAHPSFGWKFVIWQSLSWLAIITAWAPVAARTFASESPSVVKRIFAWTGLLFLGRAILPFLWGIAALAYFQGETAVPIQAMPEFLHSVLPMGLLGLVVAGMLAASMSTYSGYLLAWGSIISQDVVLPLVGRPLKPRHQLYVHKATVLCLTVFIVGWGLFYVIPGATYFYLQMTANLFLAGTFWTLVGGIYWKGANRLGALCSLVLGGSATFLYFVVQDPVAWTETIGVLSYVAAFAGMVIGSVFARMTSAVERILLLTGLAATAVVAVLGAGQSDSLAMWQFVWLGVLFSTGLLFVSLSAYAVIKGFSEIQYMFRLLVRGVEQSAAQETLEKETRH